MFWKAKHPYLFMPEILVLQSLEHSSLNEDQAGVAIRNEGRLQSYMPWAPATHMCQEAGGLSSFFVFHIHVEVDKTLHCECSWSTERPVLLHRCGLNLTLKIKLPIVAVGDKMQTDAGKKQHDYLGVFKSLI